jgi:hypothetical protein
MHRPSHYSSSDTSLEAILRRFCTVPDPVVSYEQAERSAHRDLERLDTVILRQELAALRFWISLNPFAHRWLHERVERLLRVVPDA